MQSVGQRLREARLQRERSLEDVSASTRIAVKNLLAIEADEFSKLGSPFLYKSFVRQFARELELSDDQFESNVQAAASTIPEPLMPGQGPGPFPAVSALPIPRRRSFKWLHSLASLIVMIFACSTVYSMWQSSRPNLQASFRELVSALANGAKRTSVSRTASKPLRRANVAPSAGHVSDGVSKAAPRVEAEPVTPASAAPSEPEGGYRIELSAIEPTWLSIILDGRRAFSGILEAMDTKVLEARDNVRIRTGNAGGVNVVLNGKALGAIGPRGQVRTVIFTRDAYEILPPEPHMSLTQFSPNGE
ncbi:MAG TPA: RodZ domain-containing protein [Bryobacteraceae bacterium]|jgi:cytoskeletal protein RodZ